MLSGRIQVSFLNSGYLLIIRTKQCTEMTVNTLITIGLGTGEGTKTWIPYHPSYDDYQTPGSMNRYTTKCLNIGTRLKLIDEFEIEMAFKNAIESGSAILSFTNHDFRDIAVDIENVYAKIDRVSRKFPNVSIHNSDAITAMQKVVFSDNVVENEAIKLELETEVGVTSSKILVHCEKGEVFGSQPFLAIKTRDALFS